MPATARSRKPPATAGPAASVPAPLRPADGAPESSIMLPGAPFQPVRLTSANGHQAARVPLFYIDDVEYSIPAEPSMSIALQYMHMATADGDAKAMDYLLTSLLGEDGYKALREYPKLTAAQFAQIVEIATRLTLGTLELPKEPQSG